MLVLLVPSPPSLVSMVPLVTLLVLMMPHRPCLLLSMVRHRLRHPIHSLRLQHIVLVRRHRLYPIVDHLLGRHLAAVDDPGGCGGGPDAHASRPSHAVHAHRHATHAASKAAAECLH